MLSLKIYHDDNNPTTDIFYPVTGTRVIWYILEDGVLSRMSIEGFIHRYTWNIEIPLPDFKLNPTPTDEEVMRLIPVEFFL